MGYLLKNVVYLSLRRVGYQVYVGNNKETEVDFVVIKGSKSLYFQVTLQLTKKERKEYRSFCR